MKNCPVCNQELPESHIGVRIRAHRYAVGMSVIQLAEISGMSAEAIRKIEQGRRSPRPQTLDLIKGAFGVKTL